MSRFVLKISESLNAEFDVVKGLFCSNQRDRIDAFFHWLVCLVLNFQKGVLFEILALVRYQFYYQINLKRKTYLIDSLFHFSLKVCEGLLFALKKEFFLLRIIHIFSRRMNHWTPGQPHQLSDLNLSSLSFKFGLKFLGCSLFHKKLGLLQSFEKMFGFIAQIENKNTLSFPQVGMF